MEKRGYKKIDVVLTLKKVYIHTIKRIPIKVPKIITMQTKIGYH